RCRAARVALCRRLAVDDRGDDVADGIAAVPPVRPHGAAPARLHRADGAVDCRLSRGVGRLRDCRASPRCRRACRRPAIGVADAERLGRRRGGACRRRPVSVQPAQISLPRQMPRAVRFYRRALAWAAAVAQRLAARPGSRRLLRRLLLGADAADDCGRGQFLRLTAAAGTNRKSSTGRKIMKNLNHTGIGMVLAGALAASAVALAADPLPKGFSSFGPDQTIADVGKVEWQPLKLEGLPPGIEIATLRGDLGKGGGEILLRLPA